MCLGFVYLLLIVGCCITFVLPFLLDWICLILVGCFTVCALCCIAYFKLNCVGFDGYFCLFGLLVLVVCLWL